MPSLQTISNFIVTNEGYRNFCICAILRYQRETKMDKITAIILAAGESKRMGTQKLLLPFGHKTIIENVVDNALLSGLIHIKVVLGSDKEAIHAVLKERPVSFCFNENFKEGMFSSVLCGLKSLPETSGDFMVFLGDQPFIPIDAIKLVLQSRNKTGKGIIIPYYKGKGGHPVLFKARYREEICKLDSLAGLRGVTEKYPEDVFELETNFPQILRDIDLKNDYFNELNKMNRYGRKNSI
jgi:molybdenum cofactor cytidylyltransferase